MNRDKSISKRVEKSVGTSRDSMDSGAHSVNAGDVATHCLHRNVDVPGSIFGETCLDCGLYLNNGF